MDITKLKIRHLFQPKCNDIFFLFLHENICCGPHLKRLGKVFLMSTHLFKSNMM